MLKLKANPTFKLKVGIPVPGEAAPTVVEWEFKHKTKEELKAFLFGDVASKRSDEDSVMEITASWGVDAELTKGNMELFLGQYHGAARVLVSRYAEELAGVRSGN